MSWRGGGRQGRPPADQDHPVGGADCRCAHQWRTRQEGAARQGRCGRQRRSGQRDCYLCCQPEEVVRSKTKPASSGVGFQFASDWIHHGGPEDTEFSLSSPCSPCLRGEIHVSSQNVTRTPNCAAKGMPTVVPGPKKSPSAPAGTSNWLGLVIGALHAGVGHSAVALVRLFTGVGNAEMSVT